MTYPMCSVGSEDKEGLAGEPGAAAGNERTGERGAGGNGGGAGAGAGVEGGPASDGGGTPGGHGYAVARNRGMRSAEKRAARLDRMYARRAEQPGAAAARGEAEGVGQSGTT
jgi:hypothetical protein